MTKITLVYMTPNLEGLENINPKDKFGSLDDLITRGGHDNLEQMIQQAVIYYLFMLDAYETDRVFQARFDGRNGAFILDDESEDYYEVDCKILEMEVGTLEDIRKRAELKNVDELLERSLILYEKILIARRIGYYPCLVDEKTGEAEWVTEPRQEDTNSAVAHEYKGPTLQ